MRRYLPSDGKNRKDLIPLARHNRRVPTDAEKKLWRLLRGRRFVGWKFRRQHQLLAYVVDFVCLEERLIVELDGGQHGHPEVAAADELRSGALGELGFRVLRFWNHEVMQEIDRVSEVILYALQGGDLE